MALSASTPNVRAAGPSAPGSSVPPFAPVVAHRGFSWVAPENTLAAFREAVAAGADGCEFDVRASGDGGIVVIHDKNLKRTAGVDALVASKTCAEIGRFDAGSWKAKKFAGEKIPTFGEALALLKGAPATRPVIEIKDEGIEERVVSAIREAGLLERAVVIAFSADVVKSVRRIEPRLAVAWLYGEKFKGSKGGLVAMLEGRARELDVAVLDLKHELLTREVVEGLHARGLAVWAWTVDEPARMEQLLEWGVDSITTNRPDVLLKVRGRLKR